MTPEQLNALRAALAEALHHERDWGTSSGSPCRGALDMCSTDKHVGHAARILARPALAAALAGSGPEADGDAGTCPTCGKRTCIGRLQYEDCAGSGPARVQWQDDCRCWHDCPNPKGRYPTRLAGHPAAPTATE